MFVGLDKRDGDGWEDSKRGFEADNETLNVQKTWAASMNHIYAHQSQRMLKNPKKRHTDRPRQ